MNVPNLRIADDRFLLLNGPLAQREAVAARLLQKIKEFSKSLIPNNRLM